ncbi:MAG TPA: universal stress protein [Gemmatimonadaceae bacterium]|nr:universal stress protein [Gemmatimonadaceae bacterium]
MRSPTLVLRQGRLQTPREAGVFRAVLVPLDGSAFAEAALECARAVATAVEGGLVLVRVHQIHRVDRHHATEWDAMVRADEEAYLDRVAARLTDLGLTDIRAEVLDGDVVRAICARATRLDAPLIAMSSHGRTGLTRSWLGSVADGVIHGTTTPVLIVRPAGPVTGLRRREPELFDTVIVALDGSSFAAQALPPAIGLADAMHAHVLLLRLVPAEADLDEAEAYLASVAERIRFVHADLRVTCDARVARAPAAAVTACATAAERPLVALATHGRGLSRFVIGSVADGVIRAGQAPTLLVRPVRT